MCQRCPGAGRATLDRVGGWSGVVAVLAALTVASGAGVLLKRRSGNFRDVAPTAPLAATLAGLGVAGETPVTLLQFSSAFCAPCRTTRVLCADVAARVDGVRHVEVDAESHLDAVRALDVWRTPTVLIIDAAGQIRRRATGAPTRAQLMAAVDDALA
jgi:thiol-disulfide isomerase/thioredoxin